MSAKEISGTLSRCLIVARFKPTTLWLLYQLLYPHWPKLAIFPVLYFQLSSLFTNPSRFLMNVRDMDIKNRVYNFFFNFELLSSKLECLFYFSPNICNQYQRVSRWSPFKRSSLGVVSYRTNISLGSKFLTMLKTSPYSSRM